MVSPFTFYRGAAKVMAEDLKGTPRAGIDVQLCGDAHLPNFGAFGSPKRRLVFDLNDFDETLPGPFEYDVKRMSTSFSIAGRDNGFSKAEARAAALARSPLTGPRCWTSRSSGRWTCWYASMDEAAIGRSAVTRDHEAGAAKKARRREGGAGDGQAREADQRQLRRASARRMPATACGRCRSWVRRPTAGTGSSASPRSSCRFATSPPSSRPTWSTT